MQYQKIIFDLKVEAELNWSFLGSKLQGEECKKWKELGRKKRSAKKNRGNTKQCSKSSKFCVVCTPSFLALVLRPGALVRIGSFGLVLFFSSHWSHFYLLFNRGPLEVLVNWWHRPRLSAVQRTRSCGPLRPYLYQTANPSPRSKSRVPRHWWIAASDRWRDANRWNQQKTYTDRCNFVDPH